MKLNPAKPRVGECVDLFFAVLAVGMYPAERDYARKRVYSFGESVDRFELRRLCNDRENDGDIDSGIFHRSDQTVNRSVGARRGAAAIGKYRDRLFGDLVWKCVSVKIYYHCFFFLCFGFIYYIPRPGKIQYVLQK